MVASQTRAPVEPGETHHIQIEEYGSEGDGIGYVDGFVIVVPDAALGAWVTVEIETVHETFAIAAVADESSSGSRFLS